MKKLLLGGGVLLIVFSSATPALAWNPITSLINFYKSCFSSPVVVPNPTPSDPSQTLPKGEGLKNTSGTSPVTVINDATLLSALGRIINQPNILNKLRGPTGLRGLQGPRGSQGFTGSPGSSGSLTYTFPNTDGTPGQVLHTNGAGALVWGYVGGGGSSTTINNNSQWTTDNSNIYFNTGNIGIGTTSPSQALSVGNTNQFTVTSTGAVTAVGVSSGSGLIQGTGGLTITGTISLPNSSISNAMLANSTISGVALGNNLNILTFGTHLASDGSSYNGSAGVTITSDATNANTASTIVARDASGNFSAGTITATTFSGAVIGHSSLDLPLTGGTLTGDTTVSGAAIILSGNISGSGIYGVNGIRIKGTPGTFLDTNSSGTVATAYTDVLGGNTITATTPTIITNYITQYVKDPIAGSGITLSNKWAIGADSLRIGTSNQLTVSNSGVLTAISPVFTTNFTSPIWKPASDSTTAIQINKADGTTNVLNIDTTNGRVGIGTTVLPLGSATGALSASQFWGDSAGLTLPVNSTSNLRSWKAAVATLRTGTLRTPNIVMLGDSWVANGYIADPVRSLLWAELGYGGPGWIPFYSINNPTFSGINFSTAGTWTHKNGNTDSTVLGPDLYDSTSSDVSTPAQAVIGISAATQIVDHFIIYYIQKPGGGTFQYKIDSGAYTPVSTDGALSVQTVSVATTLTYHTLTIQVTVAGTAGVTLLGADLQVSGSSGVRISALGHSGATAANYAAVSATTWEQSLAALNPDVVGIILGVNDALAGATPANFIASMTTLITRIRAALPASDIILFAPSDINDAAASLLRSYAAPLQALAAANKGVFIDLYLPIGTYAVGNAAGEYSNNWHLSAVGGRAAGQILHSALLDTFLPANLHIDPTLQWGLGAVPTGFLDVAAPITVGGVSGRIRNVSGNYGWDFVNGGNPTTLMNLIGKNSSGVTEIQFSPTPSGTVYFKTQKVGIGTTTPSNIFHVTGTPATGVPTAQIANTLNGTTQNNGLLILAGNDTGVATSEMITFKRPDNTTIGTITQTAAAAVAYNSGSDRRIKENITPTTYGLADLLKINVSDFNFIGDPNQQKMTGFIAQDLNTIYPGAVTTNGDNGTDPLLTKTPWMIDYSKLTPLLVKSVQDLDLNLEGITGTITPLIGSASETFVTAFFNNVYAKIGTWLADTTNGIAKIFVGEVHTDKLCVKKSDGTEFCANGDELQKMMNGNTGSGEAANSSLSLGEGQGGVGNSVTLESIAITTPATKLSYTVGDILDITGLEVTGTYSDATTKVETIAASDVSGFDSSVPITGQVLTVTVGEKMTTYTVEVIEAASE